MAGRNHELVLAFHCLTGDLMNNPVCKMDKAVTKLKLKYRTYIAEYDVEEGAVMLPNMFANEFGDKINPFGTLIDPKNNQFEVLVERINGCPFFSPKDGRPCMIFTIVYDVYSDFMCLWGRKNLTLKTRVSHIWLILDKEKSNEIVCMNMLLVNEKTDRIHATVRKHLVKDFRIKVEEGQAYLIENVMVGFNEGLFKFILNKHNLKVSDNEEVTGCAKPLVAKTVDPTEAVECVDSCSNADPSATPTNKSGVNRGSDVDDTAADVELEGGSASTTKPA